MNIIIYDSKCIFCCTFVKFLNIFADKRNKEFPLLYVISPNDILKIKKINKDFYKCLDINKIKNYSSSSIIFLAENKLSIRVSAILKIAKILRPKSFLISIIHKYLLGILSFLFDPFYIVFAKNRYIISKFTKPLFRFLLGDMKNSCLVSTDRIKFI